MTLIVNGTGPDRFFVLADHDAYTSGHQIEAVNVQQITERTTITLTQPIKIKKYIVCA